ncbi:MAG TPA: hypothetical protein VGH30_07985 [Jatrophihabitantaceae bacterium]|jgi:hypothetical protein
MTPEPPSPGPWNNGLLASSYVALTDVAAPIASRLLTALERARIAAYLAETAGTEGAFRLYVASAERSDARTIVAAVVRASGGDPGGGEIAPGEPTADPLAGIDAEAEFAALIADWHVDTHTAIRNAEKELSQQDEDWRLRLNAPGTADEEGPTWLDEDHYVPPTPPPLPRPTGPIMLGLLLVLAAILLLAFGDQLGMPFQFSLFLAVGGIITATVLFVMRLRANRDDDDDGAVL